MHALSCNGPLPPCLRYRDQGGYHRDEFKVPVHFGFEGHHDRDLSTGEVRIYSLRSIFGA